MTGRPATLRSQSGFTLIEVLITILVLAFGLLGYALLQTMNIRFAQSANYRTQVTNLSSELIDQMRANRILANAYLGDYNATIQSGVCLPTMGQSITPSNFRAFWSCRLGKTLGAGAQARVARDGNIITVALTWGDERWNTAGGALTFTTTTEL